VILVDEMESDESRCGVPSSSRIGGWNGWIVLRDYYYG